MVFQWSNCKYLQQEVSASPQTRHHSANFKNYQVMMAVIVVVVKLYHNHNMSMKMEWKQS